MNVLEFENKYMQYLMLDKPIPYKDILIYPVKMDKYILFNYLSNSLVIDKNNIPDPKVISMKYLDFLIYLIGQTDDFLCALNVLAICFNVDPTKIKYTSVKKNNYLQVTFGNEIKLNDFLNQVFYDKNKLESLYSYCKNPLELLSSNNYYLLSEYSDISTESAKMVIDFYKKLKSESDSKTIKISCEDFDEIKRIICYQNCIDLPEDNEMNPEIKKAIQETIEYKNRHEPPMGSIEHQINYLVANSNLSIEQIDNMTIRKFIDILSIKNYSVHYNAMLNGQYSGMVEYKESPKSPLCDLRPKDKYEDLITDYSEVKEKLEIVS